jgi:hypothetical protein
MSHLYYYRLGYDTWCILMGGILPFGSHTDPVCSGLIYPLLSSTRCQNQQDNRMKYAIMRTSYLTIVVILLS